MTFNEWRLRTRRIGNRDHTLIMGVVNVTPDSFSDGGDFADATEAIAHGRRLVSQGADVVDIGGESTRPGSEAVTADDELARVLPVVKALADEGVVVSIDTSKAAVAEPSATSMPGVSTASSASRGISKVNALSLGAMRCTTVRTDHSRPNSMRRVTRTNG